MGHLKDRKMGYFMHLLFAMGRGFILIIAGILSIIHAIFPFLCTSMSSKLVRAVRGMDKDVGNSVE